MSSQPLIVATACAMTPCVADRKSSVSSPPPAYGHGWTGYGSTGAASIRSTTVSICAGSVTVIGSYGLSVPGSGPKTGRLNVMTMDATPGGMSESLGRGGTHVVSPSTRSTTL